MYELKKNLERYLLVNLLGPGPRLIKKNLLGRSLTKVEKHCSRARSIRWSVSSAILTLHLPWPLKMKPIFYPETAVRN